MNRRRITLATAMALFTGSACFAGTSFIPAASAATTLGFGHEVVIDHQRSGFEPDFVSDSKGRLYSSVPNGSAQGESFVWRSLDHGDSWQLVPGNVAFGKPASCVGGGDTELAKDSGDDIFLSDLQNLTNLSNSVTKDGGLTFTASCVSAPNTPVDRMWYASHGKLGDPDFAIYEEYDAVLSGADPSSPVGNQLVETVSHDGATFLPVVNAKPSIHCAGGGVLNCVTDEEGLPGNQLMSKKTGALVIAHSGQDSNKELVSIGIPKTTGSGEAAITQATWKDVVVNKDICPDTSTATPGICGSANFPTIAQDSAGNLYYVYASQLTKSGTAAGPYNIYVAVSTDGGNTWSKSRQITHSGSNAFPWITAGSTGRVGIAWYHANETGEGGHYAFDDLSKASFDVQVAQSIDALSASPHYSVVTASEHPIKYGPICTAGTTCTVTMGDRSLGDYLNVGVDTDGALSLAYVDDTSNTFTTGATGAVAENGPAVFQRQISGPSMIAGKSLAHTALPFDKTSDPKGDAHYSGNGQFTLTSDNLDLTGASVTEDKAGLVIKESVQSLENLSVAPRLGGTTGDWLVRFTTYDAKTPGNGHIYYVGMESVLGGAPRYFVGDTTGAQVQISMLFDSRKAARGSYEPNGTITWHVPYSDFAGLKKGSLMYSVTGLTGESVATLGSNPEGILNLTDATRPFDHVAGSSGVPISVRPPGTTPVGTTPVPPLKGSTPSKGHLASTGGLGAPVAALVLLGGSLGLLGYRRRLADD